jgi:hypothetical protein
MDNLKATYHKKYREITNKGYTLVKMALGNPNQAVTGELKKVDAKVDESKLPKSKLDQSVQDLISFIFDMSLIE